MIYVAIEPYVTLDAPAADAATPAAKSAPTYIGGNTGRNNGFYAVGAAVAPANWTLNAASRGLRRILGEQAKRSGKDPDQRDHQKFSFPFLFGASVVMTVVAVLQRIFPV